ncbi:MAG: hypothetical protein D6798_04230 [Deltaproteobacteria bacterium]|nr:MAG: hypothetical protein D6798_04230 [Deltaproteobacteria bacterium]
MKHLDVAAVLLLALWEFPQNLLGVLLWLLLRVRGRVRSEEWDRGRWFIETAHLGVSLGSFVFWCPDPHPVGALERWTREHEYGHTVQSRRFGPLYLLVVGLPSLSRAAYSRWCLRRTGQPWAGYYDGWPEQQADRLGRVRRRTDWRDRPGSGRRPPVGT